MQTKHKQNGNQTAEQALQLTIQTSLRELGKQLALHATATVSEEQAKEQKAKAKKELDKLIHTLYKAKVVIGNLPKGLSEHGHVESKDNPRPLSEASSIAVDLYMMMTGVKHNVRRNYISSLRTCIKEDRKFNLNLAREKAKEKPKADTTIAPKAPKADDTKASEGETAADNKQSLADVIRRNFKTLLANNPTLAAELAEELAELAGV